MKSKAEIEAIRRKNRADKEFESQGRGKAENARDEKRYAKQMEKVCGDTDED